jgi:hypothetical protein
MKAKDLITQILNLDVDQPVYVLVQLSDQHALLEVTGAVRVNEGGKHGIALATPTITVDVETKLSLNTE